MRSAVLSSLRSAGSITSAVLMVLLVAPGVASAQSASASAEAQGRPTTVPGDFVTTPFGYFHPSCVAEAAPGEVVLEDGRVRRPDGTHRQVPPCNHPRYNRAGMPIYPWSPPPPTVNGWIAWTQMWQPAVQQMSAEWTTPGNPTSVASQTIYLFPGLQDSPVQRILQPVLGWNGLDGGGTKWVIYSWNCCVSGTIWHSAPVDVSAGQRVRGSMVGSNCDATTGVCANWRITTEAEAAPSSWVGTTLDTTVNTAMVDVRGGALEVYSGDTCKQFPNSSSTQFTAITGQLVNGGGLGTTWTNSEPANSPDCITGVSSTATTATINYCRPSNAACFGGEFGYDCGYVSDGCGGLISCGTCAVGEICRNNVCSEKY